MLTQRPRIGERLIYYDGTAGVVAFIENSMAWWKRDGEPDSTSFIWRFKDGLNKCFSHGG